MPEPYWAKTYNISLFDKARFVAVDGDDFVVVGKSRNDGNDDMEIIKLGPDGAVTWHMSLDSSDYDQFATSVLVDGSNYIVAGYGTIQTALRHDIIVAKLTDSGSLLWSNAYSFGNGDEYSTYICKIGNEYYVVGHTYVYTSPPVNHPSDILVMKIGTTGSHILTKKFNYRDHDTTSCATPTSPQLTKGIIAITGTTEPGPFGKHDVYVMLLDSNLNIVWAYVYLLGGSNGFDKEDYATCIKATSDGGFIVTGFTNYPTGESDYNIFVLKLKPDGMVEGLRVYDSGSNEDKAYSIKEVDGGGCIIAGYTQKQPDGNIGDKDLLLLRIDNSGNIMWAKTLSPDPPYPGMNDDEEGYSVQTLSNGYIVAGITSLGTPDILVIKVDTAGEIVPCRTGPCCLHNVRFSMESLKYDYNRMMLNVTEPIPRVFYNITRRRPTLINETVINIYLTPTPTPTPLPCNITLSLNIPNITCTAQPFPISITINNLNGAVTGTLYVYLDDSQIYSTMVSLQANGVTTIPIEVTCPFTGDHVITVTFVVGNNVCATRRQRITCRECKLDIYTNKGGIGGYVPDGSYEPGETITFYVSTVPSVFSHPVTLKVWDSNNQLVQTFNLMTDANGMVSTPYIVPPQGPLGVWKAGVSAPCCSNDTVTFKVECKQLYVDIDPDLPRKYAELNSTYHSLLNELNDLNRKYEELQSNYSSLQRKHEEDVEELSQELSSAHNEKTVFQIATVAFVITTIITIAILLYTNKGAFIINPKMDSG
ncbi:MAG: hypothetical protein QXR44_05685 [Thermoproteota archaeon]